MAPPGYSKTKEEHLKRLRRIEGQVRGLQKMVEEDVYCIDVLTQIVSVSKAVQTVGMGLLDQHIHHCVKTSVLEDTDGGDAKIDEAMAAIARLMKA